MHFNCNSLKCNILKNQKNKTKDSSKLFFCGDRHLICDFSASDKYWSRTTIMRYTEVRTKRLNRERMRVRICQICLICNISEQRLMDVTLHYIWVETTGRHMQADSLNPWRGSICQILQIATFCVRLTVQLILSPYSSIGVNLHSKKTSQTGYWAKGLELRKQNSLKLKLANEFYSGW